MGWIFLIDIIQIFFEKIIQKKYFGDGRRNQQSNNIHMQSSDYFVVVVCLYAAFYNSS